MQHVQKEPSDRQEMGGAVGGCKTETPKLQKRGASKGCESSEKGAYHTADKERDLTGNRSKGRGGLCGPTLPLKLQ